MDKNCCPLFVTRIQIPTPLESVFPKTKYNLYSDLHLSVFWEQAINYQSLIIDSILTINEYTKSSSKYL